MLTIISADLSVLGSAEAVWNTEILPLTGRLHAPGLSPMLFIDDLEALELLAPSPGEARSFISGLIDLLALKTVSAAISLKANFFLGPFDE